MKSRLFVVLLILMGLLVACNSANGTQTSTETAEPAVIPTPESGKSIIYGKALGSNGKPLKDTPVRLAEVYRGEDGGGAFALDEAFSPATMSDENGEYIFLNIAPGEYVLFIGSINTEFMIVANPDASAIVYEVAADELLEIDPVTVNFE
ncbi:MAG: hypothetical protein AB2L21_04585 [Anaerolineaceae bacterium]|jgi:hypothetical protein